MDIRLNYINRSADAHQSDILLFQKNIGADLAELAVAWKVIRRCGRDCHHPFVYPTTFEVAISDDYGNYSPRLPAEHGQLFSVTPTATGARRLSVCTQTVPGEIQVCNEMPRGAVNVNLFKAGLLVARKTSVVPGQKAVFLFKPTLWMGVVSQVVQSRALSSAVIQSANYEISLLGIASADIVLTGGGSGPEAVPYEFSLENVEPA